MNHFMQRLKRRVQALPTWVDFLVVIVVGALALFIMLSRMIWAPSLDVIHYEIYARRFYMHHIFPPEYPPLALSIFLLTYLPGNAYVAFGIGMTIIIYLSYLALRRIVSRQQAFLIAIYSLLGIIPMVMARYDIIPAIMTVFTLDAARRHKFILAAFLLTIGAWLKLYPFLLLPAVIIAQWQSSEILPVKKRLMALVRTLAPSAGLSLCIIGVASLIDFSSAFHFLRFASARPTQIESLWASIIWLGNVVVGQPPQIVQSYGSHNMGGSVSMLFATLSPYLMLIGLILVYQRQLKGKLDLGHVFLSVIGIVVITSKVLSTQYLIWLLPLVAYVEGVSFLWISICVLTSLGAYFYPYTTTPLPSLFVIQRFLLVNTVRNLLLLVAIVRIVGFSYSIQWSRVDNRIARLLRTEP
jgi:hypothetical protein